jgi:hypothetical protein
MSEDISVISEILKIKKRSKTESLHVQAYRRVLRKYLQMEY